jgi:hypothetical protein
VFREGKVPPVVDKHTPTSRRDALLNQLGGPPGQYAVLCVVFAVLWFPFELLLDKGDPLATIITSSGLKGAIWALMPLAIERGQRARRGAAGNIGDSPSIASAGGRAYARRGVIVGLGTGVPFFGALVVLCLITSQSPGYTVSFVVALLIMAVVAVRSLRKNQATPAV